MHLYLVREAGTTTLHGIFWAETAATLWDAVVDPFRFDLAEITDPSGIWRKDALDEVAGIPQRSSF